MFVAYGYVGGNPLSYSDPYGLMFGCGFSCWFTNPETLPPEVHGSASYFRGITRSMHHRLRTTGLLGECEQKNANLESEILADLLSNPDYLEEVMSSAEEYILANSRRIVGRVATGQVVTFTISRYTGFVGGATTGGVLAGMAVHGDVITAIGEGLTQSDIIAAAAAGGYIPDQYEGRLTGIDCSCE